MAASDASVPIVDREARPAPVHRITRDDLRQALRQGVDDFAQKPSHIVFLVIIYPIVALILSRLTFGYEVLPILFPLAAGFALLGPVAAIGLYEFSRRRERGLPLSWVHAVGVVRSPAIRAIVGLGAVLAVLFLLWLLVAWLIFEATLGTAPQSVGGFLGAVFGTGAGWTMIVVGNGVGFLFAVVALAISWISFPMIIDRHVDALTAVATSLRAVRKNPVSAATWGIVVVIGLVLGSIPFFVGLAITLPVLGHATWHVYRKVVG